MKAAYSICFVAAAIFVALGGWSLYEGFDKKLHYYSNEKFPELNQNVYVGGDAYNYIINSNYFTAFGLLGCAAILCATMLFCTALYLLFKSKEMRVTQTANPPVHGSIVTVE
ncbi:MAG: hypothetical protein K0Q73_5352 [Paenibacillus sp.]|jgi:peptidoglycan/LPS O-acetylase OafA/YrhL|nr:hypothetical protein [Paenibacillus sp.]